MDIVWPLSKRNRFSIGRCAKFFGGIQKKGKKGGDHIGCLSI